MRKEMRQTALLYLVIYAMILLLALLALGCNPVKQVLKDNDKMIEVWEKGALDGWCSNDTIIQSKSDTLITFDTLYGIEYVGDTLILNDVKTVIKTEYKTVIKKVIIKDTINNVVTDNSRINLLNGKLIVSNTINKELSDKVTKERKRGNKWSFRFWLLVVAAGIYFFRKPIWRGLKAIISPIKL